MFENNIQTPVKLWLPKIKVLSDRIRVESTLRKNNVSEYPAVVVEYIAFTDRFGERRQSASKYIPSSAESHSFSCDIMVGKEPFLSKSQFEISLLTQTGIKYVVRYLCDSHANPTCKYDESSTTTMSPVEKDYFSNVISTCVAHQNKSTIIKEQATLSNSDYGRLEHFRNAVFTEMFFLKNNGGRQYKVTNGKFISKMNDLYAYHFELESELYLADDSPVTVSCQVGVSSGSVLLCEGFEVLLLLEKNLGTNIGTAKISVEPWKLLEALNKRIESTDNLGHIALKFLVDGPKLATKQPASHIPKGQEAAKRHVMDSEITVIWGPPGTGKTHTMSEIAISFLKKGKTVLMVSHSNVSVDGVATKIAELLRKQKLEHYLKSGKVLRYGYIRDEKLSKDPFVSAYNYVLEKNPSLRQQLENLTKQKERIQNSKGKHSAETISLENQIKNIRKRIRLEECNYVESAQIVATTISKVYADSLFNDRKYDVVMFDEVSMAYVPQLICAATFAKEKFVCVGDFRQLSPIVQSKAKETLSKDVFSYLGISDGFGEVYAHPWLVMLNEQRRMHPGISSFANKVVYANLLTNHESVKSSRQEIVDRKPFPGAPMNLIDLTGTYCATGKNTDNSRFNILSAVLAFGTALTAEQSGEKSVAIITPYAAQTRLIRAMIQDYRKVGKTDTSCATVHQFQGSERNVIIFDAVESYPSTKTGWLMSKNDNGSVTRLVNVGVTRAKGKLIAVANGGYWNNKFAGTQHAFYKLIQHIMSQGNVISNKEKRIHHYIEGVHLGKDIQLFTGYANAYEVFEKDIEKSKKTILVSIPGTAQFGDKETKLMHTLEVSKSRGARLMMKARDVSKLPRDWKQYTWECENAIFPTVLVDDKVLWYGFPQAEGKFVDGNSGFMTVFPLWIRFSGEHTVEMIKSLAALDMRVNNHIMSPMTERVERDSGKMNGIVSYVSKNEKCCNCGQPMVLTKTKNGKTILQCTVCKKTDLLKKETVNRYINKYHVRCPYCKKDIYANVSTRLYVRCTGGHFPKIEEI